jgi:hypothetical protein
MMMMMIMMIMMMMMMMIIIIIIIITTTIKEAYVTDVAIPSSHNLHSIITDKLRMCTDLIEGFTRIWKMKRPA